MIAAGGTAGHVVPALAVADALRARGAEVTFIGGARAEAQLVPAAGYALHTIVVAGLSRANPLRAAARPGAGRARRFCALARCWASCEPDAVMGGGGYVAGPVGLAALTRRIPLVLTEADSHLGLANRVLAPFARRVCLAFAIEGRARGVATASPAARSRRPTRPRRRPGAAGDRAGETCVLVFGGSLGARSINLAAVEAFAGAAFHVLHVCGRRDHPELRTPAPRSPGYRPARVPRPRGASPTRSPPAIWSSRAPGARCSRSPPTAGRRS